MTLVILAAALAAFLGPAYGGRVFWGFVAAGVAALGGWAALFGPRPAGAFAAAAGAFAFLALAFGVPPVRRLLLSSWLLGRVARALPRMSETERAALEAGTVWWDGELFSGAPRWKKLLDFPVRALSETERAFLDGPVRELCERLDDWEITRRGDLPPEIWDFLRQRRFFGMIIPPEYGGLGFSARAHSEVVVRIASRSVTAAVTVMVPNSLGPAELLLHYGTEEQKRHFLPRLARGEEIPCFALTEPGAGSDAASLRSEGIVCRGTYEGREVLGMRLTWRKRYITLGPVATVIGLAFRLRDPERLLGEREDRGITCALVPSNLPGIEIGQRHDPLGIPFQNGPTSGTDVFVPLDFIIGGPKMAGQGWRMLMECLAAGRSISLPALAVASAELSARVAGAYAAVRRQFDTPIGRFEGVEEPLARIGGLTYVMNAARVLTAGAVDAGERPAVLSAVVKAYLTESMRQVVNDAMDIRGGAGICRGPRNVLAPAYMAVPIGITVEGANILTRSMIVYGQGAIRCHPYVREEMAAVASGDVGRFDRAFFGHAGFIVRNAVRAFALGLTGSRIARAGVGGVAGRYLREFTRASAGFALLSDAAMAVLGGQLKRREKLSGRLADVLAWLYLGSAAVKRFRDEGELAGDRPFFEWACEHALWKIREAMGGVLDNFPSRPVAWALRALLFPWGVRRRPPSDALGGRVARALVEDAEARHRLTRDLHVPRGAVPGLGALEAAFERARAAWEAERKIRDAVRAGALDRVSEDGLADRALQAGVITPEERALLREAEAARELAIEVDAFDRAEFGVEGARRLEDVRP
jgi:acyl-CoA dehydrogenase